MAQGRKGKLNFRCPLCLRRDIDMDMLFDSEKNEYYCLRCSFTGTETQVQVLNAETRHRYADRRIRITDFGPRTETPAVVSPKQAPVPVETVRIHSPKPDVKIR
jgi:predicted RNA-binding Zn-ribbon protein involved in translation (DUF1610 family)